MRVIDEPIRTYGQTLVVGPQVQPGAIFPNYGAVQGVWIDLTVAVTGATASQASNTIDNVLGNFEIDDQFGKVIVQALGPDISILNDMLTPRGVRQAPPAITTSGGGAGSAEWYLFLPITIGVADMPAQLKITLNGASSLVNGSLTSAGTAVVTLVMRAGYSVGQDQPTLRINLSNPPHQQGQNAYGPYLPAGFQVEALAFTLAGGDSYFSYLDVLQNGASFATQEPLRDFTANDVMLMQSGHLSGEFICRFPVFVVDNTTIFNVTLATDTAVRVYCIATVPQQRD